MSKLFAIICVVSWSGFWAFGYLALTAGGQSQGQLITATVLAALSFFTGMFTYLRIARDTDPGRVIRVPQSAT